QQGGVRFLQPQPLGSPGFDRRLALRPPKRVGRSGCLSPCAGPEVLPHHSPSNLSSPRVIFRAAWASRFPAHCVSSCQQCHADQPALPCSPLPTMSALLTRQTAGSCSPIGNRTP